MVEYFQRLNRDLDRPLHPVLISRIDPPGSLSGLRAQVMVQVVSPLPPASHGIELPARHALTRQWIH
jgi:hypothetical protein